MRSINRSFGFVSPRAAGEIIDVYGWLLKNFLGPEGLSKLFTRSDSQVINSAPPKASRLQRKWITKEFQNVREQFQLMSFPVSFEPLPDTAKARNTLKKLPSKYSGSEGEPYHIKEHGLPVIYYQKHQRNEAGYLQLRLVTRLADLRHKTAKKPRFIQDIDSSHITLTCGAFMGFGHIFCAKHHQEHDKNFENRALFALAMFFSLHGFTYAQSLNLYGDYLSTRTQKGLRNAYWQLRAYKQDLQALQNYIKIRGATNDKTLPLHIRKGQA